MSTVADYGEMGPEHVDRFGVRHHVLLETEHGIREFMDANPRTAIKRLGLTLLGWGKRWPGMEVFHLDIWDRRLQIHSYSDGRLKLLLDGQPVYVEKTKIVTRHGEKHREIEQWFDPAVDAEEREIARRAEAQAREDERRARLEAVRERLESRQPSP